jgi:hypothetical protein
VAYSRDWEVALKIVMKCLQFRTAAAINSWQRLCPSAGGGLEWQSPMTPWFQPSDTDCDLFFFFFGSIEVWTQGFWLTMQMLYPLSHLWLWENEFVTLSHWVCGTLWQQPRETIHHCLHHHDLTHFHFVM